MKGSIIAALALAFSLTTLPGCSSGGNEARCREAIRNIFNITGLDKTGSGPDVNAAVRSCRANASSKAIDCMIAAKTVDDLAKCDGFTADDLVKKDGENKGEGKDTGKGE